MKDILHYPGYMGACPLCGKIKFSIARRQDLSLFGFCRECGFQTLDLEQVGTILNEKPIENSNRS